MGTFTLEQINEFVSNFPDTVREDIRAKLLTPSSFLDYYNKTANALKEANEEAMLRRLFIENTFKARGEKPPTNSEIKEFIEAISLVTDENGAIDEDKFRELISDNSDKIIELIEEEGFDSEVFGLTETEEGYQFTDDLEFDDGENDDENADNIDNPQLTELQSKLAKIELENKNLALKDYLRSQGASESALNKLIKLYESPNLDSVASDTEKEALRQQHIEEFKADNSWGFQSTQPQPQPKRIGTDNTAIANRSGQSVTIDTLNKQYQEAKASNDIFAMLNIKTELEKIQK